MAVLDGFGVIVLGISGVGALGISGGRGGLINGVEGGVWWSNAPMSGIELVAGNALPLKGGSVS